MDEQVGKTLKSLEMLSEGEICPALHYHFIFDLKTLVGNWWVI